MDIFGELRRRKVIYSRKTHEGVVWHIKPIRLTHDKQYGFVVQAGQDDVESFYVCLVCDRGFSTTNGLNEHRTTDSHETKKKALEDLARQVSYNMWYRHLNL